MDPIEHNGPVINSGADIQQTRSSNTANTTVHGWLVDTCDGSGGGGASPRPTSGIAWPRQGISLNIGEATGGGPSGPIALDDLTDVDTTTTAPVDGQGLVWDVSAQQWKPGNPEAEVRIQDALDFELAAPVGAGNYTFSTFSNSWTDWPNDTTGCWRRVDGDAAIAFTQYDDDSKDTNTSDAFKDLAIGSTVRLTYSNGDVYELTTTDTYKASSVGPNFYLTVGPPSTEELESIAASTEVTIYSPQSPSSNATTVPLANGDFLRWDAFAEAFRPVQLSDVDPFAALDDLTDVQASAFFKDDDPAKPAKNLIIEHLSWIQFKGYQVPEGEQWGLYANEFYGPTFGRYEVDANSRAEHNKARRTYYDTNGIIHNLGDKPLWLNGALGNYTDNTPELRWTSGNPGDDSTSNDGNYIGLKLPAGITADTTYTFPLTDGPDGYVLSTDGAGTLSWTEKEVSFNTGGIPITLYPGLQFNFEEDGTDTPTPAGNAPPSMSIDAAVGGQSLQINPTQAAAQYLQGTYPASPFGNENYIGTQAFTFQAWFKNLNPELPDGLTRYHRLFSAVAGSINPPGGFQVRTGAGAVAAETPGAQGAMELFTDEQIIRGNTPITDDAWHHLCIQHDGLGNYVIFLDGVPDGTAKRETPYEFLDLDGFIIGGRNDQAADTFWMGHLDALELLVGHARYPATGFTPPTTPAGQPVTLEGSGTSELASIGDLNDVDTTTTPPTDGQALVWNDADQEWKPGDAATGGDIQQINSDPYWSNVRAQFSFDGLANGATSGWSNAVNGGYTGTFLGSPQITTSVYKWNSSSVDTTTGTTTFDIDLTGNILGAPSGNENDFTFEGWLYFDNTNRADAAWYAIVGGSDSATHSIQLQRSGLTNGVEFRLMDDSATVLQTVTAANLSEDNTWTHVAITRSRNVYRAYWNGVKTHEFTDTSNFSLDSNSCRMGWNCEGMDDVRLTVGVARYVADYITVPSSAFAAPASSDFISLTTLKAEVAASTDFADFQARIAAL